MNRQTAKRAFCLAVWYFLIFRIVICVELFLTSIFMTAVYSLSWPFESFIAIDQNHLNLLTFDIFIKFEAFLFFYWVHQKFCKLNWLFCLNKKQEINIIHFCTICTPLELKAPLTIGYPRAHTKQSLKLLILTTCGYDSMQIQSRY